MKAKTELPLFAEEVRRDITQRLGRVEGQIRGIARMFEEDRHCLEVLQQLASAQSALRNVTKVVLRHYLQCCATDASCCRDPATYEQLMEIIYKFAK